MIDKTELKAIKCLLQNKFTLKWIRSKFENLTIEDCIAYKLGQYSKEIGVRIKKHALKYEMQAKEEIVRTVCKEHPELSVVDKAKEAKMRVGEFTAIKCKLGIKQDKYIRKDSIVNQQRAAEIVDLYDTGIFTMYELGKRFGLSHQRISQIIQQNKTLKNKKLPL